MMGFFKKLVDSKDSDVEAHIVLLCVGVIALIALAAYHVMVLRNAFDPYSYGQGMGWLLGGSGLAAFGQGMQRKAEKGGSDESQ